MSQLLLNAGRARTLDDFTAELRLLKAESGNPSITEITRRVHAAWQQAGRPRNEWPARSTIGNCFRTGRRRPNTDLLLTVVHVLVGGDTAAVAAWRQALHTVLRETEEAGRVTAFGRLPACPALIGRDGLLAHAETLGALPAEGPGRALVLGGMAGIGKTAAAVALAHRLTDRGPVLFAHLRGSGAEPSSEPGAVLGSLLRLLGVSPDRVPYGIAARTALYRRLLAGTGAVVLLDDAADEEQLAPFLPVPDGCLTLVTSRRKLRRLTGVRHLTVPALRPAAAVELLRRAAGGQRTQGAPQALGTIAKSLGHHPQGLTVIGEHLRSHPDWALTDYYREPVTILAMEGAMRAALAASDLRLPQDVRRLLRLLALLPPRGGALPEVAALLGTVPAGAQRRLDTLRAAHLVRCPRPGHYRLHPLVHAYAEERLCVDEPASGIRAALERLTAHHRTTPTAPVPLRWAMPRRLTPVPVPLPAARAA